MNVDSASSKEGNSGRQGSLSNGNMSHSDVDRLLAQPAEVSGRILPPSSRSSELTSEGAAAFESDMKDFLRVIVEESQRRYKTIGRKDELMSDAANVTADAPSKAETTADRFYDDVYFDTDESDGGECSSDEDKMAGPTTEAPGTTVSQPGSSIGRLQALIDGSRKKKKKRKKRPVLSNDELFYDPDMDDEDFKWVERQRRRDLFPGSKNEAKSVKGKKTPGSRLPNSDATLSCPACMTVLSLDCQKHAFYAHQYRAMFVSNCVVDKAQILKYPKEESKKKKRKQSSLLSATSDDVTVEDRYHPVDCAVCETRVGVFDFEEIYHFFHVLASH